MSGLRTGSLFCTWDNSSFKTGRDEEEEGKEKPDGSVFVVESAAGEYSSSVEPGLGRELNGVA